MKKRISQEFNSYINITNGVAAALSLNLVNPYYAKFIERMGATDYHIALLNSLPALISVFAFVPGAIWIDSAKNKIKTTAFIFLLQKFFFIAMVFVPFMTSVNRPLLFVLLVGLMNFPGSIAGIGYQSCVGDLFSSHERGRTMALRNRFSEIFKLGITLISGQLLTILPKSNTDVLHLYQIFFVIAFFIGIIEVILMAKFRAGTTAPATAPKPSAFMPNLLSTLKRLPKHKPYISFVLCSLIFHFGWQMGWPLMNIVNLKVLNADEFGLAAISISGGLSTILITTFWARMAERRGNNFTLTIVSLGLALSPIFFIIVRSILEMVFYNFIICLFVAGTILILFNMLLEVTPVENRTLYIALYNIIINISAAVAPMLSVWLKDMTSLHTALWIVTGLRLLGSLAFFFRSRLIKVDRLD